MERDDARKKERRKANARSARLVDVMENNRFSTQIIFFGHHSMDPSQFFFFFNALEPLVRNNMLRKRTRMTDNIDRATRIGIIVSLVMIIQRIISKTSASVGTE